MMGSYPNNHPFSISGNIYLLNKSCMWASINNYSKQEPGMTSQAIETEL
jgi:hypothetical protein